MYQSVLYEWLQRLNVQVDNPFLTSYNNALLLSNKPLPSSFLTAFATNQIIPEEFAKFKMNLYEKCGLTYIKWFQKRMKKLYMESRMQMVDRRVSLYLMLLHNSLGFTINEAILYPFFKTLTEEAGIVLDCEYEEYMYIFLKKADEMNKIDEDYEIDPNFLRLIFRISQSDLLNRKHSLPQDIYMNLGRLALEIHQLKWQHDNKIQLD